MDGFPAALPGALECGGRVAGLSPAQGRAHSSYTRGVCSVPPDRGPARREFVAGDGQSQEQPGTDGCGWTPQGAPSESWGTRESLLERDTELRKAGPGSSGHSYCS